MEEHGIGMCSLKYSRAHKESVVEERYHDYDKHASVQRGIRSFYCRCLWNIKVLDETAPGSMICTYLDMPIKHWGFRQRRVNLWQVPGVQPWFVHMAKWVQLWWYIVTRKAQKKQANLHIKLIHKPGHDEGLSNKFVVFHWTEALDQILSFVDCTLLGSN